MGARPSSLSISCRKVLVSFCGLGGYSIAAISRTLLPTERRLTSTRNSGDAVFPVIITVLSRNNSALVAQASDRESTVHAPGGLVQGPCLFKPVTRAVHDERWYGFGLPVIAENCPACFEAPKERHHIKKLLAKEESLNPNLYPNLRQAMIPLMDAAALDVLDQLQVGVRAFEL
eukprot:125280-Pyramimonas_sp.AAC.1